ncbi:hypothetical protein [Streptomyces capitiformicae]|uniref:hypothetical protein n=1 Tax=Streptomyces capitiformicae TaxID=2014920 RepID=UPI001AD83EF7|nr:hypothetical protein [Streptomyces capitiformicae]
MQGVPTATVIEGTLRLTTLPAPMTDAGRDHDIVACAEWCVVVLEDLLAAAPRALEGGFRLGVDKPLGDPGQDFFLGASRSSTRIRSLRAP